MTGMVSRAARGDHMGRGESVSGVDFTICGCFGVARNIENYNDTLCPTGKRNALGLRSARG